MRARVCESDPVRVQQERGLGRPASHLEDGGVAEVVVGVGLGQRVLAPDVGALQVAHHAPRRRLEHVVQVGVLLLLAGNPQTNKRVIKCV